MKQNMISNTAVWLEVVPVFMENTRGIQVLFALLKTNKQSAVQRVCEIQNELQNVLTYCLFSSIV